MITTGDGDLVLIDVSNISKVVKVLNDVLWKIVGHTLIDVCARLKLHETDVRIKTGVLMCDSDCLNPIYTNRTKYVPIEEVEKTNEYSIDFN